MQPPDIITDSANLYESFGKKLEQLKKSEIDLSLMMQIQGISNDLSQYAEKQANYLNEVTKNIKNLPSIVDEGMRLPTMGRTIAEQTSINDQEQEINSRTQRQTQALQPLVQDLQRRAADLTQKINQIKVPQKE